jgi:hypothetical protein
MKNFKIFSIIALLSITFTSCTSADESVDPTAAAALIAANGNGGGSTGGGTTITGDYWPAAVNNQWIYKLNGTAQPPTKIASIDVINGLSYYTFAPQTGTGGSGTVASATSRLRKLNGDYFIKLEDVTTAANGATPSAITTGHTELFFKDYLPVGGIWNESYTQTTTYNNPSFPVLSTTDNIVNTILEKGTTVVVNGITYSNIIKFKRDETVTNPFSPTPSITSTTYWLSKNIGVVKQVSTSGTTVYTNELFSYILN